MPKPKAVTDAESTLYNSLIKQQHLCVYCGDAANSMDHFRAFMKPHGQPSGFCDDIWNLVPCCTTCNSSKGNKNWKVFMLRKTGKAPLARGVPESTHRLRMLKLARFQAVSDKYVQRWPAPRFKTALSSLRRSMIAITQKHAKNVYSVKVGMTASVKRRGKNNNIKKKI
jgi:hypothetical protein